MKISAYIAVMKFRPLFMAMILLAAATSAQEHAHHGHHMGVPEMDADGRRLESYDMKHDMTPEQLAGLREKIALYRALTDREAQLNMNLMGPNYEWYVSDQEMQGDTGVIVLAQERFGT